MEEVVGSLRDLEMETVELQRSSVNQGCSGDLKSKKAFLGQGTLGQSSFQTIKVLAWGRRTGRAGSSTGWLLTEASEIQLRAVDFGLYSSEDEGAFRGCGHGSQRRSSRSWRVL